jgi:hypothetical protein
MIREDTTSSGHARKTCTVCDKSLVRQPHMGGLRWIAETTKFYRKHAKCAGETVTVEK